MNPQAPKVNSIYAGKPCSTGITAEKTGCVPDSGVTPSQSSNSSIKVTENLGFTPEVREEIEKVMTNLASKYGIDPAAIKITSHTGTASTGALASRETRKMVNKADASALKAAGVKVFPANREGTSFMAVHPGISVSFHQLIHRARLSAEGIQPANMSVIQSLATHEFGHVLQYSADIPNEELKRQLTPQEKETAQKISRYAMKNYGEFLAEAFLAHEAGKGDFSAVLAPVLKKKPQ